MRKLLLLSMLLLLICYQVKGQEIGSNYKLVKTVQLNKCKFNGATATPPEKGILKQGWKFEVVNLIFDATNNISEIIIHVNRFTSGSDIAIKLNATFVGTTDDQLFFSIPKNKFTDYTSNRRYNGQFIVGTASTLIKIRPGNNIDDPDERIFSEISNDFNLGMNFGWKLSNKKNKVSLAAVGGFGFSMIKVTPQTTRDFITSEATQGAITFNGGLILEVDKFQIAGYLGIDVMSGEVGENWIYRNRPWIGLGLGYEIFTPQNSNTAK